LNAPGAYQLKVKHDKLLSILLQDSFRVQLAPLQLGHRAHRNYSLLSLASDLPAASSNPHSAGVVMIQVGR
jgi:hypothetical protein